MTRVFSRMIDDRRAEAGRLPFIEALLNAIGAERGFTEAILGDLAEERALRMERDGSVRASLWYLRDAMRSMPYLVRNAWQFGGDSARARLMMVVGGGALAITALVAVMVQRGSAAERIVSAYGTAEEGIVINNLSAIQLPMRVTDKRGLPLSAKGVRFKQIAGTPVSISRSGVVKCSELADATILASIGSASTTMALHCRPVEVVRTDPWLDLVQGDSPRRVQYLVLSPQGDFVSDLRGTITIAREDVAQVRDNSVVEPKSVGSTKLAIKIGDKTSFAQVTVFERVSTFAKLGRTQWYPAIDTHLHPGAEITQPLPRGAFWLKYLPRRVNDPPPTITTRGRIECTPSTVARYRPARGDVARYCAAADNNATVTLTQTDSNVPTLEGWLALDRISIP